MKKAYNVLALFFLVLNLFGQGEAVISGKVVDSSDRSPLEYATVVISGKADGKSIEGTITGADGRFLFKEIPQGEFVVTFSFTGYKPKTTELLVGRLNKIFDLGRIDLEPEIYAIGEVVVSATKNLTTLTPEKKSFDITQNISQAGGSVLDAMKNLPGVTVDQEGKVELRGSDKVTVLIDGRQSSLTGYGNQKGLSTIPVSNIERIEVINNPSAKYDATGMAGIINIIYKKETKTGFSGDIGFSYGLGLLTKRKDDVPSILGSYSFNPKYIPSLSLNYRKKWFNLFFQTEILNQRRLPNNEFTTRYYDDGETTLSQVPENRKQTQYIVKGGIDLFLNDHNTLTISSIYDYESHHDTAQVPYVNLPSMERYRYWSWLEYEITGYMNYSLSWKHKFDEPGHEINTSIQYTKGWEDETYNLHDSSDIRISDDLTHIIATEHTANLLSDYVKPLKSGRIEAGVKLQARRIPVTYTTEQGEQSIIYPGLGDWSDWGEDLYAGYINWINESKKIDLEGGLRAEYTDVFYELSPENIYYPHNDAYSYFKIFPNIRVTLKFDENNILSGYINSRIDRPGEPELRVFPKYDDPELLKVGNPYLRPQFTNTYELAYKRKWEKGSLSLSAYYRNINDPYTRIYSIDNTNPTYDIVNKIYTNVGRAENLGNEVILTQEIAGFWKISASFNFYFNLIHAYQGTLLFPYERSFSISKTTDYSADIKLNNQISLPWDIQAQLTILYYTPKNIPQGKQYSRSSADLGLKKKVLEGKGEISFSFSDIFNDFGIRQRIEGDGFYAVYENYYETQILNLGFKYKF